MESDKKARHRKKMAAIAAYSIPEAGAMVGLSRNGSYEAARRGEIPVLKFGTKLVVPRAIWDRRLGLECAEASAPAGLKPLGQSNE
jgi:hypothetical protein